MEPGVKWSPFAMGENRQCMVVRSIIESGLFKGEGHVEKLEVIGSTYFISSVSSSLQWCVCVCVCVCVGTYKLYGVLSHGA